MRTRSLPPLTVACLLLALSWPPPAGAGTYRWVDEKGQVHYGDVLPPQYRTAPDELDKAGRVKERPRSQAPRSAADRETLARQRHDRALLSSYVSAREIDLARDRALELQQLVLDGLQTRLKAQTEKLARVSGIIAQRRKAGQAVPPGLQAQHDEAQKEMAALAGALRQNQQTYEDTRARFEADRQRFLELKGEAP